MHRSLVVFVLTLLLAGCAPAIHRDKPAWPIAWQTSGFADNPLVGHIWSPADQDWITPASLRGSLADARFVLLGETHDNTDHHRLQAALLGVVVHAGRQPVVAFEMLDLDQQPALATYLAGGSANAAGLGPAVDWADSGWPDWGMYQPIAQVALAHGLTVVAANLPATTVRAVALEGFGALEPARVTELGLEQPLPAQQTERMLDELFKSHCDLVPREALSGMVKAQRLRNAIMAWRLRHEATTDGGVLIAGAGHVRTDYAVPAHLRRHAPDASVLSIAMIEVEPDKTAPADYAANYNADRLPFDYVLFTPAAEREDPCVALRKRFAAPG